MIYLDHIKSSSRLEKMNLNTPTSLLTIPVLFTVQKKTSLKLKIPNTLSKRVSKSYVVFVLSFLGILNC